VSGEVGPLLIAGLRSPSDGTTLACLLDSTLPVTYVHSHYFKDRLSGDRVALELDPSVTLKDQRVTLGNHLKRENRTFGGVRGVPFFRTFTVSIDYDRGHMYLADPKAFEYHGNALFDVPYDYDLTGFTIVANGQVFGIGSGVAIRRNQLARRFQLSLFWCP
jgi:hypothetical protein